MTRKHFEKLAEMLKEMHQSNLNDIDTVHSFGLLVFKMANFCGEQNERFDRDRFFKAVYK